MDERVTYGTKSEGSNADGRPRLAAARVLIVGVGGLGTAAAWVLAGSGLGALTLVDPDVVEISNLHRQILHKTAAVGRAKVDSARSTLTARFPGVHVDAIRQRLASDNLAGLFADVDFVIDATDGAEAKYLINDGAVRCGLAYSHAGVVGFQGQTMTVLPGYTACLRCLFPEAPPPGEAARCQDEGILGPIAGLIGSLQAAEAIRYLLGQEPAFAGRLLTYDARAPRWRTLSLFRNAGCPLCSERPPIAPARGATAVSHGS